MEFWRHTWTIEDWCTFPYILTDFKNFGFIQTDGLDIDDTQFMNNNEYRSYSTIKWKYDLYANANRNYLLINKGNRDGISNQHWGYKNDGTYNEINFYTNYNHYNFFIGNNNDEITGGNCYDDSNNLLNTFFIALKNNGFFFNTRRNWYSSAASDSTETHDPDGLRNFGQTPKLVTTLYYRQRGEAGITNAISNCQTLIGLPPSKNSSTKGFIYIIFSKYIDSNGSRNIITEGRGNDMPLNFHEKMDGTYTNHTDINNNICTLMRYPYEGSFLDNLYIMTTSPSSSFTDDVGFFSINGRNFMKPFENIVVELPTN